MQVTFLLGNGYDKSLDLPTTYKEFYQWYLKQENETAGVRRLKEAIQGWLDNGDGNWSDFEMALGQFTTVLDDRNEFINCFKAARASLMQYLNEIYETRKAIDSNFLLSAAYRLPQIAQNFFKDFKEEDKTRFDGFGSENEVINFISFNYTPLLKENNTEMQAAARFHWSNTYENTECKLGRIINVHGLIDEDPILGVNDVSQIANEAFREDKEIVELMVKGEADKKSNHHGRSAACEIIKDSDIVYIFGMSLGDTDLFWWQQLAKWFENDKCRELIIHCYVDPSNTNEADILIKGNELRDRISKHLTQGQLESKIIIDMSSKNTTVKFANVSSKTLVQSSSSVVLDVTSSKSLDTKKKSIIYLG